MAVAAATGVAEHPLRVEQLHPESPDVGAELGARRPGLQHPARGGSQGLSDHPTRRLDAHLHGCHGKRPAGTRLWHRSMEHNKAF